MPSSYSLVLDVGTTGVKSLVFDNKLNLLSKSYIRFNKKTPKRGWVEQDPKELVQKSISVMQEAIEEAKAPLIAFSGLGITNQRETVILWDKKSGESIYPAIVWEDTRTKAACKKLQEKYGAAVHKKTGLRIDPYFSATKISWILKNVPRAKTLLKKDQLAFGTIDSWILYNLTQRKVHVTDVTNASRTLLFNIRTLNWDQGLLEIFDIPESILPEVKNSQAAYGKLRSNVVGVPLPITAVCGDQQASMYAVGRTSGATKVTYGTGIFIMQNVGSEFRSKSGFFTTLVPSNPRPNYAVEAKIEDSAAKIDKLLAKGKDLNPTIQEFAENVNKCIKKLPRKPKQIIVDGGITQAPDLVKIQSETSRIPVKKQKIYDGTALGVAKLMLS